MKIRDAVNRSRMPAARIFPRCTLGTVGSAAVILTVLACLAACGTPWATGPSREACGWEFGPEATFEWSGRGNAAALGLDEADQTTEEAAIYVTSAVVGVRTFCAVSEGGVTVGPVPEDWQPPDG